MNVATGLVGLDTSRGDICQLRVFLPPRGHHVGADGLLEKFLVPVELARLSS